MWREGAQSRLVEEKRMREGDGCFTPPLTATAPRRGSKGEHIIDNKLDSWDSKMFGGFRIVKTGQLERWLSFFFFSSIFIF